MDLIVRKHVHNCSRIFKAADVHVGGCENMYIVMDSIYGREYRMGKNRSSRKV